MNKQTQYLFSYGTLQLKNVQIKTYTRILSGDKDILEGYKLGKLKITDKDVLAKSKQQFHPIAIPSENRKDCIQGVIFEITEQELIQTDEYEVSSYKRVLETFKSGKKAWVFIENKNDKYQPIDCSYHDMLLEKATFNKLVDIIYLKNSDIQKVSSIIRNVYTERGSEFMTLDNKTIIRLDRIISIDGNKLPDSNCSIQSSI